MTTVVKQDAEIFYHLYVDQPQRLKLNNEVGLDWVRRNYESWPEKVIQPCFSV